jgi:hypothetical protein
MLILTTWLLIMGAAGLCYPRRPVAAGLLFMAAGVFMLLVWAMGAIGNAPPVVAATSIALGLGNLWRFRNPVARAAHVSQWTGKAR